MFGEMKIAETFFRYKYRTPDRYFKRRDHCFLIQGGH